MLLLFSSVYSSKKSHEFLEIEETTEAKLIKQKLILLPYPLHHVSELITFLRGK